MTGDATTVTTGPRSPTLSRVILLVADGIASPRWAAGTSAALLELPGAGQIATGIEADGVRHSALTTAVVGAKCVFVDAASLDPLRAARLVHRVDADVQVVAVVETEEQRRALERAVRFAPGIGELWLASPSEVMGGIGERAAGVTRQRRKFRRTRERLEHERVVESPQRTERALISDAYLADLLHVLSDPVFSLDAAGRILSANPSASRVLAGENGALTGLELADALHTGDGFIVSKVLAEALLRPASTEVTFGRRDGEEGRGELFVARVAGTEPPLYAVVLHDLTDRHRAHRQLEEQALELELANQQLHDQAAELEAQADELQRTVTELEARTEDAERARQETQDARRRLVDTFESITDPFFTVDHEWRFTYVNPAAERVVGRTRDELLGRRLWDEFPDATGTDYYRNATVAVRERRPVDFEAYYPPPLDLWTEMRLYPLGSAEAPEGLAVYYQDITARKRAETALAESGQQFRALADAIPTLAWTARADGYIDWYNARWYEYTGSTPEQMAGWGWQSVHDPAVLPVVMGRWRASIESGAPFEMTFPLRGAHGQLRSFLTRVVPVRSADGEITRWFGTNTDVEAERVARTAAEGAEARLRNVFEQAPVAVAVLSGPEHVYTIVSPLYAESPGGGRPLLGRTVREAFPEWVGTGYLESMDRVYETGEPFKAAERRLFVTRRPDGPLEERYFNVGYQPLRDAVGQVYAIASVAYDVTEQVRARLEVEAARNEADRQREAAEDANRAKSDFLSTMSHELRTPLNAIGGYAELMRMGIRGPVTSQQRQDLERIQRANHHLMGLVTDILNFARLEAGKVEFHLVDVHLRSVLDDIELLVAPQLAAKGLAFSECDRLEDGAGRPLMVLADEEKLRQVLLNLLTNAIKFTETGGRVGISCDPDLARHVVRLLVSDTGRGIPAHELGRIFEPFVQVDRHRTHSSQQGVGLGLAISRDLARGMGGDLTVESTEGAGSTFTVELALAQQ
ncbi:MAG: PAS domain-containing protein [Gemmatimonadaceae bacterium]|nr:PAS domain-containing protein [Gemmatimonadaceae bacterium]